MNHTLRALACGLALLTAAPAVRAEDAAQLLTLEAAKELCKKNNLSLKSAQEKLVQAEALIDKAWSMVKPQLNAVGTYTHNGTEAVLPFPDWNSLTVNPTSDPNICGGQFACFGTINNIEIQKQDTVGFMASLQQPLFLAQAYTTITSANTAHDLVKLGIENVEEYLMYVVEAAYYQALTVQKFVQIAQHGLEVKAEHLKVAQAKFEVGDQPKITVLSAEIEVKTAEQDLKTAEKNLEMAKEGLATLIGRDANFSLEQPVPPGRPAETVQAFIDKALHQRRDLAAAKLNLELAENQKLDSWLQFAPSLFFSARFMASDTKGFTDKYYSWNLGLTLSLPLYDGGLRYARIDEAESKIREANLTIEDKRITIGTEIRTQWIRMELAEANLAKAREALTLAQEQVELAKVSFDAGAVTNLEVIDANAGLFISEQNVARQELALWIAILNLEKSTQMYNPNTSMAGGGASGGGGGG
jgi:outer membrane protein TolC